MGNRPEGQIQKVGDENEEEEEGGLVCAPDYANVE
jgi:hypothetical protein